jgi:hypothetical protein
VREKEWLLLLAGALASCGHVTHGANVDDGFRAGVGVAGLSAQSRTYGTINESGFVRLEAFTGYTFKGDSGRALALTLTGESYPSVSSLPTLSLDVYECCGARRRSRSAVDPECAGQGRLGSTMRTLPARPSRRYEPAFAPMKT